MDQDAIGRDVGDSPSDIVLDGAPAHLPQKEAEPISLQFSAHVYCGQTAGWMNVPLSPEVDLSSSHTVLDGDPAHPAN